MADESFASSFDAPVIETVSGRKVKFPLLDLDELVDVANFALHRRKQRELDKLAPGAVDFEDRRQAVVRKYENAEGSIDDFARYAGTFLGARDVLVRSLVKGGDSDADARSVAMQFARQRGWMNASGLAMRVATLYEPRFPNAEPGGSEKSTGDSQESSSSTLQEDGLD